MRYTLDPGRRGNSASPKDIILRPLHSIYVSATSGLCLGMVMLAVGSFITLVSWYVGDFSDGGAAQAIILLVAICVWIRSHYSNDSSGGSVQYNQCVVWACAWTALVVSECMLFMGALGPEFRAGVTWAAVNNQHLVETVLSQLGIVIVSTSGAEQGLTAYNSVLLWCSGLAAMFIIAEWSRGSPLGSGGNTVLILILSGLFLAVQSSEFHTLHWSLAVAGTAGAFYLLTGLHGSHVVLGHALLSGNNIVSIGSMLYSVSDLVSVVGLSGLLCYWHFVDGVWFVVSGSAYFGGMSLGM
jgi:cytochrome c oxidase subunit 3